MEGIKNDQGMIAHARGAANSEFKGREEFEMREAYASGPVEHRIPQQKLGL